MMARGINYVRVPAVIAKSDIAEFAAVKGRVNLQAINVGGIQYAAHCLRFETFAGSRHVDGMYHGEHLFAAVPRDNEQQAADFAKDIPGLAKPAHQTVAPAEALEEDN